MDFFFCSELSLCVQRKYFWAVDFCFCYYSGRAFRASFFCWESFLLQLRNINLPYVTAFITTLICFLHLPLVSSQSLSISQYFKNTDFGRMLGCSRHWSFNCIVNYILWSPVFCIIILWNMPNYLLWLYILFDKEILLKIFF